MQRIGPYEVLEELARGGMGVIYRARDPRLDRVVVLKLLRIDDATSRARLNREAKAMAKLVHPGVVPLLDAGDHGGEPYLVLPYVEGESLQDRLDREGVLPVRDALRFALQVGRGLLAVHELGLVHRDLKPANVLLDKHGNALLTDFGLVKDLSPEESRSVSLSVRGRFLGTPGYWPPEQALGRLRQIGPHSDVYALGATLYALLAGDAPRAPKNMIAAINCFDDPLPAVAEACERSEPVPLWLEHVLRACLRNDTARRPSLVDLLDWLDDEVSPPSEFLDPVPGADAPLDIPALSLPISSPPPPVPAPPPWNETPRAEREPQRHRSPRSWGLAAGLAVGLVLAAGIAWVAISRGGGANGASAHDPPSRDASAEALLEHVELRARAKAPLAELLGLLDRAQALTKEGTSLEDRVRFARADAYRRRGDYKGAISAAPVSAVGKLGYEARLIQAICQLRLGRETSAHETFSALAQSDPLGASGLQAKAHLAMLEQEHWGEFAERAVVADASDPRVQLLAAYALYELHSPEASVAKLEEFALNDPDDPDIRLLLALVHAKSSNTEAAIAALNEVLRLTDPYAAPQVLLMRGRLRIYQDRYDDALADLDRLLVSDAKSVTAHLHRGMVLSMIKRMPEAREAMRRAMELGRDDPQTWERCLDRLPEGFASELRKLARGEARK